MTLVYMLDTNIASYLIRGNSPALEKRIRNIPIEQICISVIVYAELRYGVARLPHATRLKYEVERFLQTINILSWNTSTADYYAILRSKLEKQGQPIGNMDMQIAAHALAQDLILITNNTREFERVESLKLQDWT